MYTEKVRKFLEKYGMEPERIDVGTAAEIMAEDMRAGLNGMPSDILMIPTYVSADAELTEGATAAVIDAGGTNFRTAYAKVINGVCEISELEKKAMPGRDHPIEWEELVSFTADEVQRFMKDTDRIGYCFSYSANITPDIDGCVNTIDKEVVVNHCEGKLVGASLREELAERGYDAKKTVIINDTIAALLGGIDSVDRSSYSSFIGQISGTGTNTCCIVPGAMIRKIGGAYEGNMLINMECGFYRGLPRGQFDILLDESSNAPGSKLFEKLTAGAYLWQLARLMVIQAHEDGLVSDAAEAYIKGLGTFDSSVIDGWTRGKFEDADILEDDRLFLTEIAHALFVRSARCMASNLLGIALLTGQGKEKPICVFAEGSLVQFSAVYPGALRDCIEEYAYTQRGIEIEIKVSAGTTLKGSAVAAILN